MQLQCIHLNCSTKANKPSKIPRLSKNFEDVTTPLQRERIKKLSSKLLDTFNRESINLKVTKVELLELKLNINNRIYKATFNENNDLQIQQIEAVIKTLDNHNISQKAYHELSKVDPMKMKF